MIKAVKKTDLNIGAEKMTAKSERELISTADFIAAMREYIPKELIGSVRFYIHGNGFVYAPLDGLAELMRAIFEGGKKNAFSEIDFYSSGTSLTVSIRNCGDVFDGEFERSARQIGFSLENSSKSLVLSLPLLEDIWSKLYAKTKNDFLYYLKHGKKNA